jgi:hypothetical protein
MPHCLLLRDTEVGSKMRKLLPTDAHLVSDDSGLMVNR